jgi:hypothetical protein
MKRFLVLFLLTFISIAIWRISERLSADAIGIALGVLFGVLAGLPVALLVMAAGRRRDDWREESESMRRRGDHGHHSPYAMPMHQPPVIVVTGPGYPGQLGAQSGQVQSNQLLPGGMQAGMPVAHDRRFKVVGEKEEWIDEW